MPTQTKSNEKDSSKSMPYKTIETEGFILKIYGKKIAKLFDTKNNLQIGKCKQLIYEPIK